MLEQWRRSKASRDLVILRMPTGHGDTAEERATSLAYMLHEVDMTGSLQARQQVWDVLRAARSVIHELNDLGAFVERGGVQQDHFFGHFHVRIIELVHLLEPLILLTSACRGSRWGIRLRAMRDAAVNYHDANPLHAGDDIRLDGKLLAVGHPRRAWLFRTYSSRRTVTRRFLRPLTSRAEVDQDSFRRVRTQLDLSMGIAEARRLLERYSLNEPLADPATLPGQVQFPRN